MTPIRHALAPVLRVVAECSKSEPDVRISDILAERNRPRPVIWRAMFWARLAGAFGRFYGSQNDPNMCHFLPLKHHDMGPILKAMAIISKLGPDFNIPNILPTCRVIAQRFGGPRFGPVLRRSSVDFKAQNSSPDMGHFLTPKHHGLGPIWRPRRKCRNSGRICDIRGDLTRPCSSIWRAAFWARFAEEFGRF